jgi:hypothetical protein
LADVFEAAAKVFANSMSYQYTSALAFRVLELARMLDYEIGNESEDASDGAA